MFTQLTRPSWSQGFARSASESAFPNQREGVVGDWVPSLGPTDETLFDVSRNKNHGTLTNMDPATDWVIGSNTRQPGYVLDFGTSLNDQHVDVPVSVTQYPFSVAAWVRLHSLADEGHCIWSMADSSDNSQRHMLISDFTQSSRWAAITTGVGGIDFPGGAALSVSAAEVDRWYFLVGVWAAADDRQLYVDGVQEGSSTDSRTVAGIDRSFIGQFADLTPNWELRGQLSSVSIYSIALTPSRVQQLYADGPARLRRRRVMGLVSAPAAAPDITHVAATAIEPLGLVTLPPSVTSY